MKKFLPGLLITVYLSSCLQQTNTLNNTNLEVSQPIINPITSMELTKEEKSNPYIASKYIYGQKYDEIRERTINYYHGHSDLFNKIPEYKFNLHTSKNIGQKLELNVERVNVIGMTSKDIVYQFTYNPNYKKKLKYNINTVFNYNINTKENSIIGETDPFEFNFFNNKAIVNNNVIVFRAGFASEKISTQEKRIDILNKKIDSRPAVLTDVSSAGEDKYISVDGIETGEINNVKGELRIFNIKDNSYKPITVSEYNKEMMTGDILFCTAYNEDRIYDIRCNVVDTNNKELKGNLNHILTEYDLDGNVIKSTYIDEYIEYILCDTDHINHFKVYGDYLFLKTFNPQRGLLLKKEKGSYKIIKMPSSGILELDSMQGYDEKTNKYLYFIGYDTTDETKDIYIYIFNTTDESVYAVKYNYGEKSYADYFTNPQGDLLTVVENDNDFTKFAYYLTQEELLSQAVKLW